MREKTLTMMYAFDILKLQTMLGYNQVRKEQGQGAIPVLGFFMGKV